MNILMVASEAAPFAKVGGLGDVVSSLAQHLSLLGNDVRVLLPFYSTIGEEHRKKFRPIPAVFSIHLGEEHFARIWEYVSPEKVCFYFLEYDRYYHRDRLYDSGGDGFDDNAYRFTFLCRAAIDLPDFLQWTPDIYHVHDWMAALVPVYLETVARRGRLAKTASVLTIHNLQHQGYADRSILAYGGLWDSLFRSDQLEACGGVNFLKGGIYFANKLSTVSRSYAEEIQWPEGGCGLHGLLRFRSGDLVGIINGIGEEDWNPATDGRIPHGFSAENLEGKAKCKGHFFREHWKPVAADAMPLFVVISRLYWQKGLDVLADILPWVVNGMAVRFAILGSGDASLENHFRFLGECFRDRIWVRIGYDESLSHLLEAAGDFFAMPSRFEPCGLNQLYSMRYGTLPIVRATGGLRESVQSYAGGVANGTGFVFQDLTHQSLHDAIGWACATYYDRPDDIRTMQRNGMAQDFSWKKSARRYLELYGWALEKKNNS
jgi:starch synthase